MRAVAVIALTILIAGACSDAPSADLTGVEASIEDLERSVADLQADVAELKGEPVDGEGADGGQDAEGALTADTSISTAGMGPVRIGMTPEEAEAASGVALPEPDFQVSSTCAEVQPDGLDGLFFMVGDGRIVRISATTPAYSTLSGAKVGSTEDEIRALFPDKIETTDHQYVEGGHYLTFVPDEATDGEGNRVVFETDGSVVTALHAGVLPWVAAVEGCA